MQDGVARQERNAQGQRAGIALAPYGICLVHEVPMAPQGARAPEEIIELEERLAVVAQVGAHNLRHLGGIGRRLALVKVAGVEVPHQGNAALRDGLRPTAHGHALVKIAINIAVVLALVEEILGHLELVAHVVAEHHGVAAHDVAIGNRVLLRRPEVVRHAAAHEGLGKLDLWLLLGLGPVPQVALPHSRDAPAVGGNGRGLKVVPVVHLVGAFTARARKEVGHRHPAQLVLDRQRARRRAAKLAVQHRQVCVEPGRVLRVVQVEGFGQLAAVLGLAQAQRQLVGHAKSHPVLFIVVAGIERLGAARIERPADGRRVHQVLVEVADIADLHNHTGTAPALEVLGQDGESFPGRHAPEAIKNPKHLLVANFFHVLAERPGGGRGDDRQRHGVHPRRIHAQQPGLALRVKADPVGVVELVVEAELAVAGRQPGVARQTGVSKLVVNSPGEGCGNHHPGALDLVVRQILGALDAVAPNNLHHLGHGP